jgi:DNA processing protein
MIQTVSLLEVDPQLSCLQKNFPKFLASQTVCYSGSKPLRNKFHLGVVGSRRPCLESKILIEKLFQNLPNEKLRIISGGALGVDAQAHHFSLKYKIPTYSWIVGDPDTPTPFSNFQIFQKIKEDPNSSILTPSCLYRSRNQNLEPYFWIERNYWIAANVDALLVIQAKEKSGTWWTVKACHDFGIPVYALSGSLTQNSYSGNNLMITNTYAEAVHSIEHFAEQILEKIKLFSLLSEKNNEGSP